MPASTSQAIFESPHWLNQCYIENALRTYFRDDTAKVIKYDVKPASAKGDNYVCIMLRIAVQYSSDKCQDVQSGSYIIKAALDASQSSAAKSAFDSYGVYAHELEMYGKVFVKFRDIFSKIGYRGELVPRLIQIDHDHESFLMEDLQAQNYKMADVRKGLDVKHSKLILAKLAKIHAVSAVVNSEDSSIFEGYDRGIVNKHSRAFDIYFNGCFEACARMVCGLEGCEVYGEKMLKMLPDFLKRVMRVMEPKSYQFNVVIHGDMWCNNAMFKYNDSNVPIDAILLDFQFSSWASSAIDLHYFYHTSLQEELLLHHTEELTQFYYTNLKDTLQDLGYAGKIPTLQEFWIQYHETAFYAFYSAVIAHPIMVVEDTDNASANCLVGTDERSIDFRNSLYRNEKVQERLKRLLPSFDRRGLLDL